MNLYYLNKLLATGYRGMLYFIIGVLFSYIIEKYTPRMTDDSTKNKYKLLSEILLNVILLVMMAYYVVLIVRIIPYPFDNMAGLDYISKSKHASVILAWSIFSIQKTLSKRIHMFLGV